MISFLAVLWSTLSPATAQAGPATTVLMFGGFGSSPAQMACWESAATQEARRLGDFLFRGFAYPSPALSQKLVRQEVEEINAAPARRFVIVGHSAGTALAHEVARLAKNPGRLRLISLDGQVPPSSLQRALPTSCWAAENPQLGITSLNMRNILKGCGANAHVSRNLSCQNNWCLHVSLFETNIPPFLNPLDLPRLGLENCRPNLEWLGD